MPITQPLPDGPYGVQDPASTPGPDMADVVEYLMQKGNRTDAEVQADAVAEAAAAAASARAPSSFLTVVKEDASGFPVPEDSGTVRFLSTSGAFPGPRSDGNSGDYDEVVIVTGGGA